MGSSKLDGCEEGARIKAQHVIRLFSVNLSQ